MDWWTCMDEKGPSIIHVHQRAFFFKFIYPESWIWFTVRVDSGIYVFNNSLVCSDVLRRKWRVIKVSVNSNTGYCFVRYIMFSCVWYIHSSSFPNEDIFVQLDELDELERITQAWIGLNYTLTQARKTF